MHAVHEHQRCSAASFIELAREQSMTTLAGGPAFSSAAGVRRTLTVS
jgi:hypothetical protein